MVFNSFHCFVMLISCTSLPRELTCVVGSPTTCSLVKPSVLYKTCMPQDPCLHGVHQVAICHPPWSPWEACLCAWGPLGCPSTPWVKSLKLSTLYLCGVLLINTRMVHSPVNVGYMCFPKNAFMSLPPGF